MKFIRPSPNSIFNCHNPKGIKLLKRLRLGQSHLRDHKFKYSFQELLNPICNCETDVETTTYYLLHCPLFSDERMILINNIPNTGINILNLNDSRFSEMLLFGNSSLNNTKNIFILNTTIESHLRDLMSLFLNPDQYSKLPYSCMAVIFTFYYLHFFFVFCLVFFVLLGYYLLSLT